MDVFSWSVPFLAEKVLSMLYTIVKKGCDDEDEVDIGKVMGKEMSGKFSLIEIIYRRGKKS